MTLERFLQELAQGEETPKKAQLAQLSGFNHEELALFRRWWPPIHPEQRRKLMGWLVTLAEDNLELDFSPIFRNCLKDDDPEVRDRAVSGLWESDDRNLVGPLMTLLKEDPYEQVRASAATALGNFSSLAATGKLLPRYGARIKDVLVSVVVDDEETLDVRRRALESAACFDTPRIRELIRWAYSSQEPKLRSSALYAMGKTSDHAWLSILIAETESDDPATRYEAVSACAELGEEDAVPYLIPLIRDDDLQVRLSAIRAISAIGGPLAERAIKRCLKSSDLAVQEEAQEALLHMEVEHGPSSFQFGSLGP